MADGKIVDRDRILSIDVIRGIALFGIFVVNMQSFQSPLLYTGPEKWPSSEGDHLVSVIIALFFQASFYPLFVLIFGFSLGLFWERAREKQQKFYPIIVRRLFFLFIIGCLHAIFIWHGDILIIYAALGFISLWYLKLPPKQLLFSGILFYMLGNIIYALFLTEMNILYPSDVNSNHLLMSAMNNIQVYQKGSFAEITRQRIQDWMTQYNPAALFLLMVTVFPLILIGAGLSKRRLLEQIGRYQKLKKLTLLSFLGGTILKLLPYLIGAGRITDYLHQVCGGFLQAVSYGCMIIVFLQNKQVIKLFSIFSYIGRMSLTTYLLQSSLTTLLFYGYGLQQYGKGSSLSGCILAAGIFIFQTCFSYIWMSLFYYGPFEWVWRSFTYLKVPKWRKLPRKYLSERRGFLKKKL